MWMRKNLCKCVCVYAQLYRLFNVILSLFIFMWIEIQVVIQFEFIWIYANRCEFIWMYCIDCAIIRQSGSLRQWCSVRQCERQFISVGQCAAVCSSVAVCSSAAVCGSAHGSVWQCALHTYTYTKSLTIYIGMCPYRSGGNESHIPCLSIRTNADQYELLIRVRLEVN
jgi:hypothetical protein